MKKLTAIFIMVLILSSTTINSLASASINFSKPQAEPGSSITISGIVQPDSSTIVKITDENGDIIFFEAAETDASGRYSIVFMVPDDISANRLTVTAGSGSDVAMALLAIINPPTPTTSSPGQTPAHSPEKTPLPSSSPDQTPTCSPEKTPLPSSSFPTQTPAHSPVKMPLPSPTAIRIVEVTPVAVKMDEKAGFVTIGIDISDLPKGTTAVKTPDGNIVYIKDAVSGVLRIEVGLVDISLGKIELTAIGEDQLALAAVRVQMRELPVSGGLSAVLWLLIGGTILLTTIIFVNTKGKRRKKVEF
jgi:hypothetical protein